VVELPPAQVAFWWEAWLLLRLRHPQLPRYRAAVEHDTVRLLVMDYVDCWP